MPPVALAIIGAWRMGTLYGRIANELALTRLVALTSDDAESTRQAAQLLGVPGYDARRCQEVLVSLRAGKHVLVEKPRAVSAVDASTLVTAGRESGEVFASARALH